MSLKLAPFSVEPPQSVRRPTSFFIFFGILCFLNHKNQRLKKSKPKRLFEHSSSFAFLKAQNYAEE
jgi:hypothetical protein